MTTSAGMTEACGAVALPNIDKKVSTFGCAGTLLPGIEARVVKADGSDADFNECGELWIKSPSNALGYLNNEQAYVHYFFSVRRIMWTMLFYQNEGNVPRWVGMRPSVSIIKIHLFGRWVLSGDDVAINEKREVFVRDRIKEMLKVKAFQGNF